MIKGCNKEIDFITGQGIIMRTERCGVPCTQHKNLKGIIYYCNECKLKEKKE